MPTYTHARPALTVDIIVRANARTRIVLIRRAHEPFASSWALPGGFVEENEPPADAAVRELAEETGIALEPERLTQLGAYGNPGRDPRGWTVSIVFVADVDEANTRPQAGDDAGDARWWSVGALPPLVFDHARIIADALSADGFD